MNREIVDYIVLSDVRIERKVMEYIKNWRQPFWSPFMSCEIYTRQAMVKYAPLPDDSKSLYSESHLKNLESMPRLDLDMDKGEYTSIPSSAFEAVSPSSWTNDND